MKSRQSKKKSPQPKYVVGDLVFINKIKDVTRLHFEDRQFALIKEVSEHCESESGIGHKYAVILLESRNFCAWYEEADFTFIGSCGARALYNYSERFGEEEE